jgi:hypothetical protein
MRCQENMTVVLTKVVRQAVRTPWGNIVLPMLSFLACKPVNIVQKRESGLASFTLGNLQQLDDNALSAKVKDLLTKDVPLAMLPLRRFAVNLFCFHVE